MALGICLLALKNNVRLPDGLLLSYPALSLNTQVFTPSFLNTFTCIIVTYAFLDMCLKFYMKDPRCDPTKDPFLSPLLMPDEILKKLPPMRILCGEDDCLKDDAVRFLYRTLRVGKDAKMNIYKGLRHGFLNWDVPMAMPATRKCGEDAAEWMRELID